MKVEKIGKSHRTCLWSWKNYRIVEKLSPRIYPLYVLMGVNERIGKENS